MDKELKELIKKFMLENKIGYIWFSAFTNIFKNDIKFECEIELEDDIQNQGYKC